MELSRRDRAENEIDQRMYSLMLDMLGNEVPEFDSELVACYMRAAYMCGYRDCLKEPDYMRGKWIRKLGYDI